MNVLFLDQFSALGGAQQCLLDLLPAIQERGWKARVAIPRGGPLINLLRARGVPVDEIQSGPYRSGTKSAGDVLRFAADVPLQTAAIAALLRQSHTDLVYVNGPRVLVAAALAVRGRMPILFHAHHSIGQASAAYLEGLALRRSGATIAACCAAVAQPIRKWVASGRIHTIPNGTPDFGFRERSLERRQETRIGIIGRIAPEKGQTEFLRAAALLVKHLPRARFVVCGAPLFGDREYYRAVLRLSTDLPVELLDWHADVGAVMRDLDILVIASKQEGMPRVMLEAFSAGLPVVAFPVGGIPEAIDDGISGFLTRGASPSALAATLSEVVASPDRMRSVSHTARVEWERHYTLAAYCERITTLMEQCAPPAVRETAVPQSHRSATQ
jgi:glycosyltransferase involved in cell wall biosynthesis